jgi:hypothetical protein
MRPDLVLYCHPALLCHPERKRIVRAANDSVESRDLVFARWTTKTPERAFSRAQENARSLDCARDDSVSVGRRFRTKCGLILFCTVIPLCSVIPSATESFAQRTILWSRGTLCSLASPRRLRDGLSRERRKTQGPSTALGMTVGGVLRIVLLCGSPGCTNQWPGL